MEAARLGFNAFQTIVSDHIIFSDDRIGVGWARFLPAKTFKLFGRSIELNPGPFNVKEHTIITMMTAAGSSLSYAIDILLAQEIFYKQEFR